MVKSKSPEEFIRQAIEVGGPYSHNIVSMTLSDVARKRGKRYANELVRKYNLTEIYGIQEEPERRRK
jgi:hypothetical protein